jgi:hypothetical protein
MTCLEIGSGWVLSHALVLHLLGAERVIATVIAPVASPSNLRFAVGRAVDSTVRDVLAPFAPHEDVRERMARLRTIKRWDMRTLEGLGIEYRAPLDLAKSGTGERLDRIFSIGVLSKVPFDDVPALLANVSADLGDRGQMLHAMNLEDPWNLQNDPFGFLGISSSEYGRQEQNRRGNRIRKSGWTELFDQLDSDTWRILYSYSRYDRPLPTSIDESVRYVDEADLRVSHIGVHLTARSVGPLGS